MLSVNLHVLLCVSAVAGGTSAAPGGLHPASMRCEYLVDPVGVGTETPRFYWTVTSSERGQAQSAYQILVSASKAPLQDGQGDQWDSGRVASDETLHVAYQGKPLASGTTYYWTVRVWDRAGNPSPWSDTASFTMGLLNAGDWQANWLEAPRHEADPSPKHNGFHTELSENPDEAKWVSIDLGASRTFDRVQLHPARPYDYTPDTPGFLFPVRFRIDVSDDEGFEDFRTVVDKSGADFPNPGEEAPVFDFEPVDARYVRLYVNRLAERDAGNCAFALAQARVFHGGTNIARNMRVVASDSVGGSWSPEALVNGRTEPGAGSAGERHAAPVFRKEFALPAKPVRALLHISALGLYEAQMNGRRIGDHILAPEWTDYDTRVQCQTYDVAPMLKAGDNAVAVTLGDGWYAGRIGLAHVVPNGLPWAIYGANPKLIAQLHIDCDDGSQVTVVTDDSWRWTRSGPVGRNDTLDGVAYDARKEMPGFSQPGFDDADWQAPHVTAHDARLVAQPNEPIRVTTELTPVALTEPSPGVFIFDLGQNMVGRARITAQAPEGTVMTVRHGEALNPDGTLYVANLRGAPQIDRYTFRGQGAEVFEPSFTYHGFRYVELSGLPAPPAGNAVLGRVFHSDSPVVGSFECSDAMLNKLAENILWTQRANLMSSPTDCPQRDERLGWMGDIQVFAQTAIFNMDMAAFFSKWLQDVRDAQAMDGRFPDFAPHPFGPNERFSGVPAWGDAGVFVPWRAYENYGDTQMLSEQYEAAKRWIGHIRRENPDLIWRNGRHNDYGDWLNGDTLILDDWPKKGGEVPKEVMATAFFARSTEFVSRMANVLGNEAEAAQYARLAGEIRAAFQREFIDGDGRIPGDTQAGYALALHFGLVPEEQHDAAVAHMVEAVRRYDGRISTGIQSTIRLMMQLTYNGHIDLAYALALNREIPSWGYAIDQGATTIWERWDGYVEGRGFQSPGMNSFNHWALGAVGEWLFRVVGGINPAYPGEPPCLPAFKRFVIHPRPGGGLTWATTEYQSIRGPVRTAWRVHEAKLTLEVSVPANTTAIVYVPTTDNASVTESGHPATAVATITPLRVEDGCAVFEVASGDYVFEAKR
ncbi:MAG: family 78 glycoside hydrolase catalytic domain [Candidatus Hydrogenedentes bacterium]|nr:family 78 glycoside hydrolase catalytic domain [Candidatus Hydrogenedentota bacterium]